MLQTIMNARKEHAFSKAILSEYLTMVSTSRDMLGYAFKTLQKQGKGKKAVQKIYVKDREINFTERAIRKRVLVHLALKQNANLPEYLGLISIAKDAERLGDYVKNMFELSQLLETAKSNSPGLESFLETAGPGLLTLFDQVIEAFRTCDQDKALLAINAGNAFAKLCEQKIEDAFRSNTSVPDAVALTLGARYMKRIARHLVNISSSIVNPMPDLDFSITDKA